MVCSQISLGRNATEFFGEQDEVVEELLFAFLLRSVVSHTAEI